ncbi:MAG: hypothetical protein ACRD0K_22265 [Egibacteraceae bacterium]
MRRTVRRFDEVGPEERLGAAISRLPGSAQRALEQVAEREDLPLVSGSWQTGDGGCLVANVVQIADAGFTDQHATLDLRVLALYPELSSLDLNRLIVAWDESAARGDRGDDAALRRLLRAALVHAGCGSAARCGASAARGSH